MEIRFRAIEEEEPGARWQALCEEMWPAYRDWFLREGEGRRPGFVECRTMLRAHMRELVPIWERLVDLAGGGDMAARMLSLYRPTPYMSGCSQAVWLRDEPVLVRNYDYHPERLEGTILKSGWTGTRVLAMSDCLWGVLDGVNEHGVSVSLAFGGRRVVGDGFGIPLILRYVLEFCRDVESAVQVLERVPSHMSYNVTILDATGRHATVHVSPDQPARRYEVQVATNHQAEVEWTQHAALTRTEEREELLTHRLRDPHESGTSFVHRFLAPPLYQRRYSTAFGTLYTAAYSPAQLAVDYLWPARVWHQSLDSFDEGEMVVRYRDEEPEAGSNR